MCFVGDSFTAGVGDPERRGWVGRVAAGAQTRGAATFSAYAFTTYNLGIRLNTSTDVRSRWRSECEPRLPAGCDNRVVLSFGVNDTTAIPNGTRVEADLSCANLADILDEARALDWPVLVVGPAPIADGQQNARIRELDDRFAKVCAQRGVPYIAVFAPLDREPAWKTEVQEGDGSHPTARGYDLLTKIIFEPWWTWLCP